MEVSLSAQATGFLLSALLGACLAVFYDLLGALRRRGGVVGAAVCDLVFSAAFGLVMFAFAMGACEGRLRLYAFAGAGLGGAAWFLTLSRPLRPVFEASARILGFLARATLSPFVLCHLLIKKLSKYLKNIFHFHGKWYRIRMPESKPVRKKRHDLQKNRRRG